MVFIDPNELELKEKIIHINRCAKVVKGGRRFSFAATVVVGNGQGILGVGHGKAREVPEAIRKAGEQAKRHLIKIPIKGGTLPHEVLGSFGAGEVLMKPASPGTGVIAGGPVRMILEVAGVQNVLTKCLGTSNPNNVVRATMDGLSRLRNPEKVKQSRQTGESAGE